MKIWIQLIIGIAGYIGGALKRSDREIEQIALHAFGDTPAQYDRILRLCGEKIALLNLAFLHTKLRELLAADAFALIERTALGHSVSELADECGLKRQTVYKRLCRAFESAERVLASRGIDEPLMQRDYAHIAAVKLRLKKLERGRRVSNKEPGIVRCDQALRA